MAKDKKKKLPKGFVPFKKKDKKTAEKPAEKTNKKKGKKKLDENILKFVDLMISEDYKNAHKVLEIVVQNKIKKTIAEAAKKDLFPKAKDGNPNYLKNKEKKQVKNNKKNN
jgi:hypothetical protein